MTSASSWIHEVGPWAGTANTLLLIVLAIVTRRQHHELKDTHQDVTAAASAAASAALSAADAARVAKAIGGSIRHEAPLTVRDPPEPGPEHG